MIDLHCHLDLYPDPASVVRRCVEERLYILSVTTTPSAWRGTQALAEGAPRVRTALGLHPQLAHERKGELKLFSSLLKEARYVGEVGLDGSPELRRHWSDQLLVFGTILEKCSEAGGRILTVHSRRAASHVLEQLTEYPKAGTAILHWFTGTQKELKRASDLDCWFSIGPAMLVTDKGRSLVARMPRDRVLTESDGPFATIDNRSALPWDTNRAVDQLASCWGVTRRSAEQQLLNNLKSLVSDDE